MAMVRAFSSFIAIAATALWLVGRVEPLSRPVRAQSDQSPAPLCWFPLAQVGKTYADEKSRSNQDPELPSSAG